MDKKKIKIVIDASRNRSGGAIIYLINFIKHLNLKKTNIKSITLFSHKFILNQLPDKPFLKKLNHSFLEKNIFFQILWQWKILPNYLKKNKIDILYSTDSTSFCKFKPNIIFNQDILSFDKKSIESIPFGFEKIRLYLIRLVQIKAMNNANEIIFLSQFSKNLILKYLKKNRNYNINYHGVEKKLIKMGKKKLKKLPETYNEKDKINLIYVSPLFNYKNQLTVVRAYLKLKKKYNNLEIKFIGSYKHNLKLYNEIINQDTLIKSHQFLGQIKQNQVIKHIYNSDIFLFASSSETFGISLLEAMALGMPIVCSNKSSLPEILKNGGLYFNPKNHSELANKIELLIKDKVLRNKLSQKAFNLSLNYNWNENVKKFCKIINKL